MKFAWMVGLAAIAGVVAAAQQPATAPAVPLKFGVLTSDFAADGSFTLAGPGWPPFKGTWKAASGHLELLFAGDGPPCPNQQGVYTARPAGKGLTFTLVSDECKIRRLAFDNSRWVPPGEAAPSAARRIVRTAAPRLPRLPAPRAAAGSWPSFRGLRAAGIAEKQNLPDRWDGKTLQNVLWKVPIPGLAHSSPIVWGDRVFVTTAVSSRGDATFKPGLYGDGDASEDRSRHQWMIYALDRRTGQPIWNKVAHQGEPVEKRHIKSTYASSTPATDGRIVVASFGSHGVHAFDVNGNFRWKVDVGRLDVGAYDLPTVEWGTASSPIIWNDLVILQYDTQSDSFLLALDAATGETVWKVDRQELPSWGTPTVVTTSAGEQLVTNASNFIRAYEPKTGKELWRIGRSSKITAPTPIAGDDLIVVASGRRPEQPIFAVRSSARGDITLAEGKSDSDAVAWSRTGRGSYMPTPLIYDGLLYVLGNNGIFDAYRLKTGEEVYRQRLPHLGSGFSASPVAADGKIYISGEDGEMLVIAAGPEFTAIATNTIGEPLMATPAISGGVMYVRSAKHLFAIGRKQ